MIESFVIHSIKELAERVGCNPDHLGRIESGEVEPKALLLHDIARVLGILVDALYDRDWSWQRRKELTQ